jgi:hypothetical protein
MLKGSNLKKNPDEFFGVAILIRSGSNITIKNLKASGYKVALMAKGISNLTIENCDFSYNCRQHLNSTQEKEDISDWLSHHQNEKDEWLRYGAAMYLRDCESTVIKNTKVTGGQNALMMTNCNKGKICNNDFSFNSGLGLPCIAAVLIRSLITRSTLMCGAIVMEFITVARTVLAFWYMNKVIVTFFIRIL